MNRTITEINVNDRKEQEDGGLIAAIIIFSGSLLITLAALVSRVLRVSSRVTARPARRSSRPVHTLSSTLFAINTVRARETNSRFGMLVRGAYISLFTRRFRFRHVVRRIIFSHGYSKRSTGWGTLRTPALNGGFEARVHTSTDWLGPGGGLTSDDVSAPRALFPR